MHAPVTKLWWCRSLAAAEQLSRVGYGTLAWINGGLDTAKKSDLPVKGEFDDLRYGGIGGLSELLGWTDVQREKSAGFLGAALGSRPGCSALRCPVQMGMEALRKDNRAAAEGPHVLQAALRQCPGVRMAMLLLWLFYHTVSLGYVGLTIRFLATGGGQNIIKAVRNLPVQAHLH